MFPDAPTMLVPALGVPAQAGRAKRHIPAKIPIIFFITVSTSAIKSNRSDFSERRIPMAFRESYIINPIILPKPSRDDLQNENKLPVRIEAGCRHQRL